MKHKHRLQAWEMMREAKDCLGMPALERIFRVGHKQLYKMMRNPDYDGDSTRPVIQRVRIMLHDLNEAGGAELAHAMLDYMAEALGRHTVPNATGTPDKGDVLAECLDDYPPLTKMHNAIQAGADLREVQALAEDAKSEIDETVVSYIQGLEG
jgi:hypothetical protein